MKRNKLKNKKSNKKINNLSLSKIYSNCLEHIKTCKMQIHSIILIFLVFAIIGFFLPISEEIMNFVLEYIQQILEQTKDMSVFQLIYFIFSNNLQASFLGLALGLFFGIFPVFFAIFNGYILGIVASLVVSQEGILSLLNLFPHGIFELPAVFISLGMGLKLGSVFFQEKRMEFFKKNVVNSAKVFVFVVIPLLIVAAIIEGALIFLI